MEKNKLKNKNGITLIALVVTIIVLLILAGISIAMLTGRNGVLTRAGEARYTNTIGQFDERVKLAQISLQASITNKSKVNPGYVATESSNFAELAEEVANDVGLKETDAIQAANGTKINTEGYTVGYYLDTPGNDTTDGVGYIVIWYTDNSLRASIDRNEVIFKYGVTDIAKASDSRNQATLVRVIAVENYGCSLSDTGLTSATDGDNDIKETKFDDTTIKEKGLKLASSSSGSGTGTGGGTGSGGSESGGSGQSGNTEPIEVPNVGEEVTTPIPTENILKVNTSETATTDEEKSPFVRYNGVDYRVLYDADSTYARIELISVNPVTNISLGKNDSAGLAGTSSEITAYKNNNNITIIGEPGESGTFDRAKWSYNNAIATLNYKAQAYLPDIADRARCVGSNPSNPNNPDNETNPSMYSNDFTWMTTYGWNNVFKVANDHHEEDYNQLGRINARACDDSYWLASRIVSSESSETFFCVRCVRPVWRLGRQTNCAVRSTKAAANLMLGQSDGLRPCVRLKSGVKVTSGKGTVGSPYILSAN